jgi:saccharopine dehydrogenase-like NADP-dependent oxidoreductase
MDLCKISQVKEVLIGDIDDAGDALARKAGPKATYPRVDIMDDEVLAGSIKGSAVTVNCTQYYHDTQVMMACIVAGTHHTDLGGPFPPDREAIGTGQ